MIRSRLTWLDALRGYAAAVVALFHLSPQVIGLDRHMAIYRHFDFGRYGVLLFFLVSGYVIPMSLERHGSLRRFWIGRVFRIYPAYLLAIVLGLALAAAGWQRLHRTLYTDTAASVLGHATMLQDLLGLRGVVRPFWTLSYEMTFYLIVAGLFAWRWHRASAWWAGGLALIALLGGRGLPDGLFPGARVTAGVLTVVLISSLILYLRGRARIAGVAGLAMILLPLLNGQPTKWASAGSSSGAVLMIAVMFAGTVVHRAQHRQIDRRAAAAALILVLVAVGVNQSLLTGYAPLRDCTVAAAVAGTFAIAFLLRHRAVPSFLTWLGVVSFSVYLLHMPVLVVVTRLLPGRSPVIGPAFVAGTLAVAWMAYHLVERPGQRLGRRVADRLDARFGPDTPVIAATTEGGTPSTGSFGMQRESV
ncbi:acyltransferase [Actinoplanes ianthinogenes]|uniref:Acyltransferase n=1 Tax=Actinoplanes ianthinogenes TaxID=122358 RepID=A0ABM7LM83_9ACTN|nr:acyltransferase [Actinoplanes ianthinogenes]BCJ40359.1 acyltransferase [Actinoplanes ianthinogenes]GGR11688.1 acyltransferase [Actinoplanes ianthinogenes]